MNFSRIGKYLLIPFAIIISFIPVIDPFNLFNNLKNSAFDIFQNISPRESISAESVLILDIDEESLSKLGQWPWPRTILSDLVDKTYLSAVLGFDVVFAENDRTGSSELKKLYKNEESLLKILDQVPNSDNLFSNSIANHGTVVLGAIPSNTLENSFKPKFGLIEQGDDPRKFLTEFSGIQTNLKLLDEAAKGIGSMSIGNNDSVIRKLPLFENINGSLVPSLSLEMLRVAIGASTFQIKSSNASGENAFGEETGINNVKLGNLIIPTNDDGSVWIHYSDNPIKKMPIWEVFSAKYQKEYFEGKILIVGASAPGLFDLRSTPLENNVPGVQIIANLTDQILAGQFLKRPDWMFGLEVITGLLLALLITFFIQFLGPTGGLMIFLGGNSLSVIGSYYIFNIYNYLIDPISPLVICLLAYLVVTFFNFLFTELERSKVRNAFSQYMSPVMVEKLAKSSESLKLGGERKEMTFLFSDIRGFTSISEKYKDDPEALTDLINNLLTVLSNEILTTQGTIDKYMGDCIMAFWNAPSEDEEHREKSIEAAFAMSKALNVLNEEREKLKEEKLSIGIGINTGDCIVGNMGSDKRFDYTVLGDSVNLASRLEGQSANYGMQIILGEETTKGVSQEKYTFFELDLIAVKGKSEPVSIFTVFDNKEILKDSNFLEDHNEFLKNYRSQNWEQARNHINKYRFSRPEFTLYYSLFFERIDELSKEILPEDWSGVFVAKAK
tara:strand:+ start:1963 stop:4143 length:2181 start_codon:yes stop_codon:yes gene_type:complete